MFAKQICKNANLGEKPYNINKVDKVEKAQLITGNQINSMKMLPMLIHYQKVEKCFSFIVLNKRSMYVFGKPQTYTQ